MQFMLLVLGLNEAHADYACPFCTVHKDERYVEIKDLMMQEQFFICMYECIDGIHQSLKYCTLPPKQGQLHHFDMLTGF